MILADSHCHIDFEDYAGDRHGIIAAARAAGVRYMLDVSVDVENWTRVLSVADADAYIYASVGVHPNEAYDPLLEPDVDTLITRAQHPKIVAIGETGLDYYRGSDDAKSMQQARFHTHIEAARLARKPLIIHTRAAAEDTLGIMRDGQAGEAGGVMHCFAEDWTVAQTALDLGFYISFSGIITFKNALALQEVARRTPLDRMLIETDSPFLAPVPHRGKTNQPAYVLEVARKIAELKQISIEKVAEITTANFLELFRIPTH